MHGCMNERSNEWMKLDNERTDGWIQWMNAWLTDWMNEWMNECMNAWNQLMQKWLKWKAMNELMQSQHIWLADWLTELMQEWTNEWRNEWMNEWITAWMNGWRNERMNEWMNECMWWSGCMN